MCSDPPAPPGGRAQRLARAAFIDVRPLRRHRDYRRMFAGQSVSFVGSMITYVAVPYEVYRITGSSLAVGLLGLAEIVPLVVTAMLGGLLADTRDRRRIAWGAEFGLLVTSVALVVNASLHRPHLWVLYAAAAVASSLDGIQRPSVEAMLARLVDPDELSASASLQGLKGTIGMIGGPALAGLLLATVGLAGTFAVDVATFSASLLAFALLRRPPPIAAPGAPGLRSVVEGLRYARSRQELLGTYVVDVVAMFFGMPTALFPALAHRLQGGPGTLGLLYSAPAIGAMLATLGSGWVPRVRRQGLAILVSAIAWGGAIAVFGLVSSLWAGLLLLAGAGAADMVSGIVRMTMWNQTIPDRLRGRLAGIEMLSYASGPSLGNVEAGAVASIAGLEASLVSGGLLCIAGALVCAWLLPGFRRYRHDVTAP